MNRSRLLMAILIFAGILHSAASQETVKDKDLRRRQFQIKSDGRNKDYLKEALRYPSVGTASVAVSTKKTKPLTKESL